MTEQLDFDFKAHKVRRYDPDTSREAWERLAGRVGTQRRRVYNDIASHGQATYREISQRTGLAGVSVSTRLSELLQRGMIVDTGERRDGQRLVSLPSEREP